MPNFDLLNINKYIVFLIYELLIVIKVMISILIPVNNFDIVALVHSLKNALEKVPEFCELIIGDDGSTPEYHGKYQSLAGGGVKVIVSKKNIGRAAIRNKLALEAKGDHLLFIDADAMLPGTAEAYLLKWIPMVDIARVISGGTLYHESPPGDPDNLLRWKYGRMREQKKASERNKHPHADFSTFNFLIDKSVFSKIRFLEDLKQYGHEDTLLGYQLKKAGIDILHIDNGLIHEGLETNREFLNKTRLGIENLSKLYDIVTDKRAFTASVAILRVYNKLRILRLSRLFAGIYIHKRDRMERELDTGNKSVRLFSFYKMSMFCTFREIHKRRNILPFL